MPISLSDAKARNAKPKARPYKLSDGEGLFLLVVPSRDHQGPRAVLNNLERLANGYGSECDRVQQNLSVAESQLRDYQARLGKSFLYDAYLSELTILRDELKAGLSAASTQSGGESHPSSTELANEIKALKAANNVETAPPRTRQKHSSAEEPITARIRRRPAFDSTTEGNDDRSPAPLQNPSIKPSMTFQELITEERKPSAPRK